MEYSKQLNIFERLAAITAEIPEIPKDLTVEKNGKTYSALSESAVLAAVRPLEAKFRVYSYPVARRNTESVMERDYIFEGQARKSTLFVNRVEVTYRFVNMDKPDEFVETVAFGTGIDTGDKAPGKATTYSDKYALMKMYKICGGSAADPDSLASPDDVPEFSFGRSASNPMMVSAQSNNKTETKPEAKPKAEAEPKQAKPAEAETEEFSVENIPTTEEEAKAVVLGIGTHKGKTFGEILAIAPELIRFYAGDKFNNPKFPEYKEAAKLLLPELE